MLWLVIFPSIVITSIILLLDGGHFTYTLDDPYIHLALAKNIMLGNYGINPGEMEAPSSSILWPFLLAPFSVLPEVVFELTPLVLNLLFLSGFVFILNLLFAALPIRRRLFTMACVVLSLNVIGLVFNGMEHELQVVLVALIVLGLVRKSYRYVYIAAIILPFVRYEGLAISIPVLAYCFYTNNRRYSLLALIAIAVGLCSFSLWLHGHGLGYLPSSVLAKSRGINGVLSITLNLGSNLKQYGFMVPLICLLSLYFWRTDRGMAVVVIGATTLHLLFGQSGWYGRYEVYWLTFVVLLAMCAALDRLAVEHFAYVVPVAAALPFLFTELAWDTISVPLAASNIANEQGRMSEIARALGEPVAVNDIGLISLRSHVYVLDVLGLSSIAVLRARQAGVGPAWIESAMKSKGIEYAFIYDAWFPDRPQDWIKVATLNLLEHRVSAGRLVVSFYATNRAAAAKLREVMERDVAQVNWARARIDYFRPQPESVVTAH